MQDSPRFSAGDALAISAPFLILGVAASLTAYIGMDVHPLRSMWIGAVLCFPAILLQYIGRRLYSMKISGRIILDCRGIPGKIRYFIIAACISIQIFSGFFFDFPHHLNAVLGFTAIASIVSPIFERLQIRENGIWYFGSILSWERIDFYEWGEVCRKGGEGYTTLLIQTKNEPLLRRVFWGRPRNYTITMPMVCKDSFDDVLNDRLP